VHNEALSASQDRARNVFDRRMANDPPQSIRKAQMKTILMLISLLIASPSEGQVKRMRHSFAKF
jgi:hypothetical protein